MSRGARAGAGSPVRQVTLPAAPRERWRLAGETQDPDVLHALAQDPTSWVRKAVAWNAFTAPHTLTLLADDPDPKVRYGAARNANTPVGVLVRKLTDPDKDVRYGATRNKSTPTAALAGKVTDPDQRCRMSLTFREDCPVEWLRQLTIDSDPDVRFRAIRHEACPTDLIVSRAADPNTKVRNRVTKSLDRLSPDEIAAVLAANPNGGKWIARNHEVALSEAVLTAIAAHEDKWIRCDVVDRPDCPASMLAILARDKEPEVRRRVAGHRNATEEILTGLARGRAPLVVLAIRDRDGGAGADWLLGHADARVRVNGVKAMTPVGPDAPRLARLVHDPAEEVRVVVASVTIDPDLLADMAHDEAWKVRLAVANNGYSGHETISVLVADQVAKVKHAAMDRFLRALAGR